LQLKHAEATWALLLRPVFVLPCGLSWFAGFDVVAPGIATEDEEDTEDAEAAVLR
jgi:hypothetical protein